MKTCPVCKIDYSDKAEFCKKCEAHLLEKTGKPQRIKTDYRKLTITLLGTAGFILFIMLIVYIYNQVAS